ncbi:TIGR03086 family metal-binding protein [Rhodococcus sp. Z13]|uniref:TIGR03086 family metal-binding protein n=1 Tax=Rhodococcus sacchari TaxID=2962047 RepID=A0ACD4DH22_9NOCA|nr:TIGR03086 family metal-binding protein [Rhodococcus sp. Z13]UYP19380.1 TIGR03086 family metal-binding protein [Rhodococcus sp. Z13]
MGSVTAMQQDPRPLVRAALDRARRIVGGVRADQLTAPTPCPGFDVRALAGHLASTLERSAAIGAGRDPLTVPESLTAPDDDWPAVLETAAEHYWQVWDDDALLDRPVTAPWGTFPGRVAMFVQLDELLVHGWDLAVATGQDAEADPALAEAALEVMRIALPESPREGFPFYPPVPPAPDAGPTERLANWVGRASEPWVRRDRT